MEMEEVFPMLAQLPGQISAHLQEMIHCLEQAVIRDDLRTFGCFGHISEVLDTNGKQRCLFKEFSDDDANLARNEACVYILDHPEDDHRSRSSQIYGFSGVPPAVFVRFRMGNRMRMGALVEFVKAKGSVNEHGKDGITLDEIHKIVVADIRFGNMDRSDENLLVQEGKNGSLQLVPVDHELSFGNDAQDYNIVSPSWRSWLEDNEDLVNAKFSLRSINYIAGLNPDEDINFLRRCGWEPGDRYIEKYKVFATFLKKTVSQGVAPYDIGMMAAYKCKEVTFNLQEMVNEITKDNDDITRGKRDDEFYAKVETHIEKRVREYLEDVKKKK